MTMSKHPALVEAYERAVVALLNACPQATEDQAEAVIDAFSELIFTTMKTYVDEEQNDSAHH